MPVIRPLIAACLAWLPLLLFELVAPNSAAQVFASSVLAKGFLVSTVTMTAVALVIAFGSAITSLLAGQERSRDSSVAAAMASPAAVLVLQPRSIPFVKDGMSPEFALACLTAAAVAITGMAVAAVLRTVPQRTVSAASATIGTLGVLAFAYKAYVLRLASFHFRPGGNLVLEDPRTWILGAGAIAAILVGRALTNQLLFSRASLVALLGGVIAPGIALTWHGWWPYIEQPALGEARPANNGVERFNIVVLMIDTVRADHTAMGGYDVETTPFLAGWDRTTEFTQALAPAASTRPSTASLFTSRWPNEHKNSVPDDMPTLPSELSRAGFRTAAFSANNVVRQTGIRKRFDHFEIYSGNQAFFKSYFRYHLLSAGLQKVALSKLADLGLHKVTGKTMVDLATGWLEHRPESAAPFFLYLHILDPHWPYHDRGYGLAAELPEGIQAISYLETFGATPEAGKIRDLPPDDPRMRNLRGRYDEEVRAADAAAEHLNNRLRELALNDSTMLIVLGDHGEEFFDHNGFGHGHDVYNELVHVPFIIRWPKRPEFAHMPRRISRPVSLLDVLPTLVDYLDLEPLGRVRGRSLRSHLENQPTWQKPILSMEIKNSRSFFAYRSGPLKARLLYQQRRSRRPRQPTAQVFDLASDPLERHPLPRNLRVKQFVAEARIITDPIWMALAPKIAATPVRPAPRGKAPTPEVDDVALERLRALGYID